ncbi:MAG: hypothetical protein SO015_04555 [Wujia sp.]|nr:hypothetical protein [Wujia sp.]MCI6241370.1 hypothetical protein [Clostridium sp.]MDD7284075.1 hypothetical protein [Clostridium sp.]MDY3727412.1 hypothetical protein [Wujia sp.]
MKKKYFVRGLGIGIIFGALIMLAAYLTSGKGSLSDEEVMKRAQELGMVKKSEYVLDSEVTSEETTTEAVTTEASVATEKATEEATTEAPGTTEKATEEAATEAATTEKATTEAATTEQTDAKTKATITVSGGMSSETISSLLENAGLVDSASKFNSFLVQNGYDKKLETGSFDISGGMTYEEIARILTTKQ